MCWHLPSRIAAFTSKSHSIRFRLSQKIVLFAVECVNQRPLPSEGTSQLVHVTSGRDDFPLPECTSLYTSLLISMRRMTGSLQPVMRFRAQFLAVFRHDLCSYEAGQGWPTAKAKGVHVKAIFQTLGDSPTWLMIEIPCSILSPAPMAHGLSKHCRSVRL